LTLSSSDRDSSPFFSICIPQYNRTDFLLEALRVLGLQTCKDFEVCISDDRSPEARHTDVVSILKELGLVYQYRQRETNGRYDRNLRSALEMARGRYCFLMGNDDCMANPGVLEELKSRLQADPAIGVVVTNYEEYAEPTVYRRVTRTKTTAGSTNIASRVFRNFSFVSGVVLRTDRAMAHTTTAWDGSEMYQMFLGCRILAEGHSLLEIDEVSVRKGIALEGQIVDSYATKPIEKSTRKLEIVQPFTRLGGLVCAAIDPYIRGQRNRLALTVFGQVLCFPYPFWILEYRRVRSWRYALGISLGMRPGHLFAEYRPPLVARLALTCLYMVVTPVALVLPKSLFFGATPALRRFAKAALRHR
jgi:glycosyltransferase involved in cell wall biosynthesis